MNSQNFMGIALHQACLAAKKQEVPVGAVLVYNNQPIIKSHNLCILRKNPMAHAEIIALSLGLRRMKSTYLDNCDLYVTLEPCALCAGAIALARIRRLYFGAYDPKGGGVEHGAKVFQHSHHKPEVIGGVQQVACSSLLQYFFQKKRIKVFG